MKWKNKKVLLSTGGFVVEDERIYFPAVNTPHFFQYDKTRGKIELLQLEETKEKAVQQYGFVGCCKFDEKIIFAPYRSSELLIYDIQHPEKSERIHLASQLPETKQFYCYYVQALTYLNMVYCFGEANSEMICLDMDTGSISVVDTWKEAIKEYIGSQEFIGIHTYDKCVVEGALWAPLNYENRILELNLRTGEAYIHKTEVWDIKFSTICFDGVDFWLTGNKSQIIKWNKDTGKTEVLDGFPEGFIKVPSDNEEFFYRSLYENGDVYFFPMASNMALKVNIKDKKIEEFYKWDKPLFCNVVQKWEEDLFYVEWVYLDSMKMPNSMLISPTGVIKDENIFVIDRSTLKWPHYTDGDRVYEESAILILEEFIENEVFNEKKLSAKTYKAVGERIYLEVKNSEAE